MRPQEHVLCRLLADGACSAFPLALFVLFHGFLYFDEVEAVVGGKAIVLGCDDGHRQVGRNPVERHPLVMPCGTFSFKNLLHTSDNHQRRDVHRHKTINHYHYSSGYKEEEQQIADYPQGVGKLHGRRMITIVRLQRS